MSLFADVGKIHPSKFPIVFPCRKQMSKMETVSTKCQNGGVTPFTEWMTQLNSCIIIKNRRTTKKVGVWPGSNGLFTLHTISHRPQW